MASCSCGTRDKLNTATAVGIPGDTVLEALNKRPLQSGTLNARYNCFGLFFYLIVGLNSWQNLVRSVELVVL